MPTKTLAPISEVTTPMGSSTGLSRVLASRSHSIRKMAPIIREAGSRRLWLGPVTMRTMWGMINPTKPMEPPMATATPMRAETLISISSFTRRTGMPMWYAFSSPIAKAFSSPERSMTSPPQTSSASSRSPDWA